MCLCGGVLICAYAYVLVHVEVEACRITTLSLAYQSTTMQYAGRISSYLVVLRSAFAVRSTYQYLYECR